MTKTICGIECGECMFKDNCGGCAATGGRPFGGECMLAACCNGKKLESCKDCKSSFCEMKKRLIAEFNALGIEDMDEVTDLNALAGSFINMEYTLPGGQKTKLWDDTKIYLGNQLRRKNSDRCYGITTDGHYLAVCEYGENGADAELVILKKCRES